MEPTEGEPPKADSGLGQPPVRAPKSRRRRWLIVAFVLVLVSVGTWWNWPRGDARFVGKWSWINDRGVTRGEVHFQSSGFLSFRSLKSSWSVWTVKGDILTFGSTPKGKFGRQVSQWLYNNTHRVPAGASYVINAVNSDSIELRDWTNGPSLFAKKITLKRIPE